MMVSIMFSNLLEGLMGQLDCVLDLLLDGDL